MTTHDHMHAHTYMYTHTCRLTQIYWLTWKGWCRAVRWQRQTGTAHCWSWCTTWAGAQYLTENSQWQPTKNHPQSLVLYILVFVYLIFEYFVVVLCIFVLLYECVCVHVEVEGRHCMCTCMQGSWYMCMHAQACLSDTDSDSTHWRERPAQEWPWQQWRRSWRGRWGWRAGLAPSGPASPGSRSSGRWRTPWPPPSPGQTQNTSSSRSARKQPAPTPHILCQCIFMCVFPQKKHSPQAGLHC